MKQKNSIIKNIAAQNISSQEPFDYEAVSAEMENLWPQLFGPELHIPLMIGITDNLYAEARASGSRLSKRKIRLFLGRYCTHPEYLKKISDGQLRHDTCGIVIDEEISFKHIKNASRLLSRGFFQGEEGAAPDFV